MSSPGEGSSSRPDNRSHYYMSSQSGQEVPAPIDGISLMNYAFTFEQNVDDAVTASFRIEADV
jgi:hypothetical protein